MPEFELISTGQPHAPPSGSNRQVLKFTVFGKAQPGGSKKAFAIRKGGQLTGRVAVTDANPKATDWKQEVRATGADHMMDKALLMGPLTLTVRFYLKRPVGHYGAGMHQGTIRRRAPMYPYVRPDLTKLTRALEDALTGIVWHDDAQIVEQRLSKLYDDPERVEIEVGELR